jgi:hypothetical protein
MKIKLPELFGSKRQKVTITAINLKLHNHMHSMQGMEVRERVFSIDIPFKNKSHTDMLTEATSFKAEKAKPVNIKGIEVGEPFKLLSATPNTPISVEADQRVDFKLMVEAPEHNYTGPISISFLSDSVETLHIEISKTILILNGKRTEIETSSRILNLPKGQIFGEKVQLYKAMSYGDHLKGIELEPPFKFVSSEPKLPLKIDDTNSYILEIYIQAPDQPYAGPLEIKLSQ